MSAVLTWAAAAFAACLPVSISLMNISAGVLTAVLVASLWSEGRSGWDRLPRGPLAGLAVYLAVSVLTAWLALDPRAAAELTAKDFHKLWIFVVLSLALPRTRPGPILAALGAGYAFIAAWGVGQSALLRDPAGLWVRAHGFVHPVTYGEQLALGLLGGLVLLVRPPAGDAPARRLVAAWLTLVSAAFVLNQTRGALLGLVAGACVILALEPRARRAGLRVALAGLAVFLLMEALPTRRSVLAGLWNAARGTGWDYHLFDRWELWKVAWLEFLDRPWTGVGPSGYLPEFHRWHPEPLAGQAVWGSAHNLYLHQLAERGLVGAAALAALLASFWAAARRRQAARRDAASLWALAACAAFAAMNLTEVSLENELVATLLLFVWCFPETATVREESRRRA